MKKDISPGTVGQTRSLTRFPGAAMRRRMGWTSRRLVSWADFPTGVMRTWTCRPAFCRRVCLPGGCTNRGSMVSVSRNLPSPVRECAGCVPGRTHMPSSWDGRRLQSRRASPRGLVSHPLRSQKWRSRALSPWPRQRSARKRALPTHGRSYRVLRLSLRRPRSRHQPFPSTLRLSADRPAHRVAL